MTPSQNLRDFLRVIIGYSFINVKDHLVFRIKMDNLPRRTKEKNRFTSFEEELKIVSVKKNSVVKSPAVLSKIECLKLF